jgi:hypothetical protein
MVQIHLIAPISRKESKTMIKIQMLVVEDVQSVDELILARRDLKALLDGYQEMGMDTPEWVEDKMLAVQAEIDVRIRADLQKRLKTAKARRAALATADEKRARLDTDIAELEKKLGG